MARLRPRGSGWDGAADAEVADGPPPVLNGPIWVTQTVSPKRWLSSAGLVGDLGEADLDRPPVCAGPDRVDAEIVAVGLHEVRDRLLGLLLLDRRVLDLDHDHRPAGLADRGGERRQRQARPSEVVGPDRAAINSSRRVSTSVSEADRELGMPGSLRSIHAPPQVSGCRREWPTTTLMSGGPGTGSRTTAVGVGVEPSTGPRPVPGGRGRAVPGDAAGGPSSRASGHVEQRQGRPALPRHATAVDEDERHRRDVRAIGRSVAAMARRVTEASATGCSSTMAASTSCTTPDEGEHVEHALALAGRGR